MALKLIPQGTKFNFLGLRKIAIAFTALSTLASIVLLVVVGLNFGIDFRGGTMIQAATPQEVTVSEYRDALADAGVGEVTISRITDTGASDGPAHQVMLRIVEQGDDADVQQAAISTVQDRLRAAFPDVEFLSVASVGGKVSGELIQAGVLAVALSVVGVVVYIWLRFEWQFAIAAVISLVHDVFLTLGLFSLLQLEFSLSIIAALLTIVGYSLNDTVIVFDRVRENLRKYKKMDLGEIINLSTNETLSRTLMTSGTTLIALLSLYFLGGPVISGFTFAMIWGVLIGTYSSIYVAGVVVFWLGVDRSDKPNSKAGTQFANIDA
ncbi:protein translocase subunit SecF [Oceanicella sp. SM1341]|uniref:protein translocase subunit SecF n=1 Tax=Oceanicella sp. SM1341 TaxID=1548889 RepID=UPI000E47DDD0|nr:protein translocase subunit SecF [Oceanicella sp. SM1341]